MRACGSRASAASHAASPQPIAARAPRAVARGQKIPAARGTNEVTSTTFPDSLTSWYMESFEVSAIASTAAANPATVRRIVASSARSPLGLTQGRTTFSARATAGARRAPPAVERMAEMRAPKKSAWTTGGVRSRMRVGRISCGSSAARRSTPAGSIASAAQARKIGIAATAR